MFKSPFLYLAALGLIALGGYFLFQNALKQAAKEADLKCQLTHKNQAIEADMKADKDKDEILGKEQAMTDSDILDQLISIGIVRADNDR